MIEKSVVPREVILLIKENATTKPESCWEKKGAQVHPNTSSLYTPAGLSAGGEAQQAGVTHHLSLCLHSGQKHIGQNRIYSGAGSDPELQSQTHSELWQVLTQPSGGSDLWAGFAFALKESLFPVLHPPISLDPPITGVSS